MPRSWPQCCSTSSISTDQSNSRVKAPAFSQNCLGQKMPNTSGVVLCFSSCVLTTLESLVLGAQDCPFGFPCCSPCWLAGGCSESKGRVRKRCWRERGGGAKCSRWDQRMFFILQSVRAFKYKKDPLSSSIPLYTTPCGKKKRWFG